MLNAGGIVIVVVSFFFLIVFLGVFLVLLWYYFDDVLPRRRRRRRLRSAGRLDEARAEEGRGLWKGFFPRIYHPARIVLEPDPHNGPLSPPPPHRIRVPTPINDNLQVLEEKLRVMSLPDPHRAKAEESKRFVSMPNSLRNQTQFHEKTT